MKDHPKKTISKEMSEFKRFIMRGNVLDLAVGVVIGGAFGKIVSSLVNDLLMPLIGMLMGGHNFSNLSIKLGDAVIQYGSFLQNVVDFLIISASIFFLLRFIERFKPKKEVESPKKVEDPKDIQLLEEIRDLLKEQKKREK